MNKDMNKLLGTLERQGFAVEQTRGGVTVTSPNGDRRSVFGDFKSFQSWADKMLRAAKKTEGRDRGGQLLTRDDASRISRRLDGVLIHWDKLPEEQQLIAIREMLHRLSRNGVAEAADALTNLGG